MISLFNKHGDLTYNPPVPAGWEGVLQGIRAWRDTPIPRTANVYYDLAVVHEFVHARIGQRTDMEIYGMKEVWALPIPILNRGEGDCEDHAILKWAMLNGMGYPLSAFSIAAVIDKREGIGHAVLVYMNGNIILDSKERHIYPDHQQRWYDPAYAYGYNQNWIFR